MSTEVIPTGRLRRPDVTVRTIWRLAALLRRRRPDLLLNWNAKTQLYGAPAAALVGIGDRIVWWQHLTPEGHWMDRLATLMPAMAIGCWSNASQAAQAAISPRRPSFVVNPGIDVDKARDGAPAPLKAQLEIPLDRLVVGIVGRLQPWKGQDRFLGALGELRRRGRDVHGLIVGGDAYGLSPEYPAELEKLIQQLELSDFVTMTGQVPDADPYFRVMDVAVNASEGEPFGIVLLEAMAVGVPVVAVAEGGPVDIIKPGVSGELAETGAPGALADAIDVLLSDPVHRAAVAAEGRRRCNDCFTAQRMADKLAAELREIAGA
jgi:glycosyltransferase involved in cell wall biosynthesis